MRRLFVVVLPMVLVGAGFVVPTAHADTSTDAVETRFLEILNAARVDAGKGAEVMHAGLREKTQQHSEYQASIKTLTHDGFSDRIHTATPDPVESNGAPDDGFGAACENVAYFGGYGSLSVDQVAQKFYDLWFNSSGHHDCMFDAWGYGLNVAGIGVYQDSRGYWWATFESVHDTTPPTAAPAGPAWTRVEQVGLVDGLGWKTKGTKRASADSFSESSTVGDTATFTFDGTGIRYLGYVAKDRGIADVTIDGASARSVDLYSVDKVYKKVVFEETGLDPGTHTIVVTVTGTKNVLAKKGKVDVDAFEFYE